MENQDIKPLGERINFISDKFQLKGILQLTDIDNLSLVIGSHGLEGSKESSKQKVLSKVLVQENIDCFLFDHRDCGENKKEFIGSSMGRSIYINALEKLSQMNINLCVPVLCSAPVKNRTIEDIPLNTSI